MIDSQSIAAEVFRKREDGVWFLASEAYTINDSFEFGSADLQLSLVDLYADTEDLIVKK